MATQGGRGAPHLATELFAEGWRFSFFQAVRLLQLMAPDGTPVGAGDDPAAEPVRFTSRVTLSFPPGEIHEILPRADADHPDEMVINFMGLASPASYGSLPMPYASLILDLERDKNNALKDFLDLFNHRLVSLFYRAWEKSHFAVGYERSARAGRGAFERALLSLMGLGTKGLQGRLDTPDCALLARAHAFGSRGVSAQGLATLVRDYFRIPARVRQFVPAWYRIEAGEVIRLGAQSCHLGEDTYLGSRLQMAQSRFRIELGPLTWSQMTAFLPNGAGFRALSELCALSTGPHFDFDFRLQLAPGETPPLRLGQAAGGEVPRLGWSTWLHRSDDALHAAEVIIDGELPAAG